MYKRFIVIVTALIFIMAICAGCGNNTQGDMQSGEKVQVAVSILPQAKFVERIGKDRVEVEVMIPPGANPVTHEPAPGQLKSLSRADAYIKIGNLPFEKVWMDKIKDANKDMKIIDSSRGIDIIDNDPHIWLSPLLAQKQVQNIYEGLVEVDPENKDFYRENKEELLGDLSELDREIEEMLSGISRKTFLVFHPSWGYFAKEYDLEQISIEIEGKEPGAGDIVKVVNKAKENDINVVFASPQFNTKLAETVAGEIGGEVVTADPLAGDYMANLREVSKKLAAALE